MTLARADLLDLLHEARSLSRTAIAVVRDTVWWEFGEPMSMARNHWTLFRWEERGVVPVLVWDQAHRALEEPGAVAAPDVSRRDVVVERRQPDVYRVRIAPDGPREVIEQTSPGLREVWSKAFDAGFEKRSTDQPLRRSRYVTLLDPWPAVGSLQLEVLDDTTLLDRPAVSVRAIPRAGGTFLTHLPDAADEYRITVDAERGTLLSVQAARGGRVFEELTVTDIEYDTEPRGNDLPFGEAAQHSASPPRRPAVDRLPKVSTVPDIADVAPFTLYVPERGPTMSKVDAVWLPHQLRVVISYTLAGGIVGALRLIEQPADDGRFGSLRTDAGWALRPGPHRTIARDLSNEITEVQRELVTVRGGTEVYIQSDLSLEEVEVIAGSLVPASPTQSKSARSC